MSDLGSKQLQAAADRLRSRVLAPLAARYPGKKTAVELLTLAVIAREHLLIVGPPGTAKSALISEFAARTGLRYFEYLLTRFTEPSEIFGPVDVRLLREGAYRTRTEGMLPEAEIAFLDEIFNAGSAILNGLLGILNDGLFRRGPEVRRTPLISAVAAANRIPEDPELEALTDRFALRAASETLRAERLEDLLAAGWQLEKDAFALASPAPDPEIPGALRALQRAVLEVPVEDIRAAAAELVRAIRTQGIFISDRRAVKLLKLAAASAVVCGRLRPAVHDLWPALHIWTFEDDAAALQETVEGFLYERTGGPAPESLHPLALRCRTPAELLADVRGLEEELEALRRAETDTLRTAIREVIRNRVLDLDSERRWLRPHPEEDGDLRELEARFAALLENLADLEEESHP